MSQTKVRSKEFHTVSPVVAGAQILGPLLLSQAINWQEAGLKVK